MPLRSA